MTDGLRKSESDLKFETIIEALQLSKAIVDELTELRKDLADEEKANLDKAIAVAKTANDIQKLVKQFKITEDTLKGLSTEAGTDDATLKKLRAILGRMIRGEQKFLDLVKTTVGSDAAFTKLEKPILRTRGRVTPHVNAERVPRLVSPEMPEQRERQRRDQ